MRLTVSHVTTYRFDPPVRSVVQSLRMTPSRTAHQTAFDWKIEIEGAALGAAFRDGAGDWIVTASLLGPIAGLQIAAQGTVATEDNSGVLTGHEEKIPPLAYLESTVLTRADGALRDLARSVLDRKSDDALCLAHDLAGTVSDAILYRPGATAAHTSAADALTGGEGVCQDHAHVLIALAHVADIPARYVSGYLFADGHAAPHEAAHAWAELWVPDLGWVGFDPANRCCPDERYVRIGSGIDAHGAAPVRGVTRGGGGAEALDVSVEVAAAQ
ncbi:MAG: transglutaminase family protein [Pseudomonadota bacterium]